MGSSPTRPTRFDLRKQGWVGMIAYVHGAILVAFGAHEDQIRADGPWPSGVRRAHGLPALTALLDGDDRWLSTLHVISTRAATTFSSAFVSG